MKKPLSLAIMALSVSMSIGAGPASSSHQDRAGTQGARERFIGAWRLVWLEEPAPDGNVHKADCTGMFVFTPDGHASVQVMYRNAEAPASAAPVQYARGGYEASFGRYDIDERAQTFTFHIDGALVRGLIGKDLVRAYEFSGNQLIVKSANASERWRVAWEHD
jgi:hypothetical protein